MAMPESVSTKSVHSGCSDMGLLPSPAGRRGLSTADRTPERGAGRSLSSGDPLQELRPTLDYVERSIRARRHARRSTLIEISTLLAVAGLLAVALGWLL